MTVKKISHNDALGLSIWVSGEGPNPPAAISKSEPKPEELRTPLQALIAHLDLDEWEPVSVAKYDDKQKRRPKGDPKGGQWTEGGYNPNSKKPEPEETSEEPDVVITSDVNAAAQALLTGKKVQLNQTREVSTLLDKLAEMSQDAISKGEKAPNYNLCNVSVKGTNLFCAESKGIARIAMPQLKGVPLPGSKAAKELKANARGEYDLSEVFREHLVNSGYTVKDTTEKAAYLRASQSELNGSKVAGMAKAIQAKTLPPDRIFVSQDNYIVDGHHRWAATVGVDALDNRLGDDDMPVARINMSIIPLLAEAKRFAKEWGMPQADVTKAESCGCQPVEKAGNPYHDERGRFTDAEGDADGWPPPPEKKLVFDRKTNKYKLITLKPSEAKPAKPKATRATGHLRYNRDTNGYEWVESK